MEHSRVEYCEVRPDGLLSRFVRCLWNLRAPPSSNRPAPQRVLPDGTIEVVFNLGDPFEHHRESRIERQPRALLVGELLGPMMIAPTGTVDLVGIRFRPGGARPFLGRPLDELTGRTCRLEDVSRPLEAETLNQLSETDTADERVRRLQAHLLSLLDDDAPMDGRVAAGVDLIEATGGRITVDALARTLNLSSRQLARRFADAVGIGPKALCRIIRFQRVFSALGAGPDGWTALALRCGYYDQAHLIRDFHQFAGQSPTAFLSNDNDLAKLFTGLEP